MMRECREPIISHHSPHSNRHESRLLLSRVQFGEANGERIPHPVRYGGCAAGARLRRQAQTKKGVGHDRGRGYRVGGRWGRELERSLLPSSEECERANPAV